MAGMSSGSSEYDVPLNLVALIDILTNILFFLLMGAVEQEMQFDAGGKIKLPTSSSSAKLELSVAVSVSAEEILVEQVPVAKLQGGKIVSQMEGEKIVPLYDRLNGIRAAKLNEGAAALAKNDDVVFLVSDREVPFTVLTPVIKK